MKHDKAAWRQKLMWMQKAQKMPHALLLNGTCIPTLWEFANEIGKGLFCHAPQNGVACGTCKPCLLIVNHTHPDWHEILPEKESIKIEGIRLLQTQLSYCANQKSWKLILIPQADTMTLGAANALLKILEEPPSYTLFILTTSHLHHLLATVRSRCEIWSIEDLQEAKATEKEKQLCENLMAFTQGKISFYDVSQLWSKEALPLVFSTLFYCLGDLIKLNWQNHTGALYFGQIARNLKATHPHLTPRSLFQGYDALMTHWHQHAQGHNLNTQLVIECLLLNWQQIFVGTSHPSK